MQGHGAHQKVSVCVLLTESEASVPHQYMAVLNAQTSSYYLQNEVSQFHKHSGNGHQGASGVGSQTLVLHSDLAYFSIHAVPISEFVEFHYSGIAPITEMVTSRDVEVS